MSLRLKFICGPEMSRVEEREQRARTTDLIQEASPNEPLEIGEIRDYREGRYRIHEVEISGYLNLSLLGPRLDSPDSEDQE